MNERSIFLTALEQEDATERTAYLDSACGDNPELRQRVEFLLQSHTEAGSFLAVPALQQANGKGAQSAESGELGDLGETQVVPDSNPDSENPLDFLSPSEKSGSLGRLGHYEVLELVGRGGFGQVMRAFDAKLHRVVAVKVMAKEIATNAVARKRFIREAQAAAAVTHENVVAIHEIQESGPVPYLVMQFVDGKSLQQRIKEEGSLELKEILRLGLQIASGLAAAHKQGLVHRDIKPGNILLENGVQRVKITDFGLARAVDDTSVSHSGIIAGTPQFMSPEQADGQPVDHRSDLFSLGSVLYAMCTGRSPFRGSTTLAVLRRVCEETPRPIQELNPDIPPWLCDLIAKLHAKKPAERYQTAKEVAEVLERHLAQVQQPEAAPQPERVALPAKELPSAPLIQETTSPRRRRRWLLAGAAAVLVAGLLWFVPSFTAWLTGKAILQIETQPDVLVTYQNDVKVSVFRQGKKVAEIAAGDWMSLEPDWYQLFPEGCFRHAQGDNWVMEIEPRELWLGPGKKQVARIFVRPAREGDAVAVIQKPAARDAGFVPLFNGKDLSGWKPDPNWKVENGILSCVAPGNRNDLLSERDDYEDFYLRVEVKINDGGNSGIFFRMPGTKWQPDFYEAQINSSDLDPIRTGSLWQLGANQAVLKRLVPPDTWFTYEIIAVGNQFTLKVNGETTTSWTDPSWKYRRGRIALQQYSPQTLVHFRKIEIKELPAGQAPSATLPDTPDQALPALAGAWKGEYTQRIYGGKPALKQISAVAVNDWIVGQKWLRQRVHMEDGGFLSLASFEPNSKTFRDWFFSAPGLIFGPLAGRWDQATRTMTSTNLPEDGVVLLLTWRFVDADTITSESVIRDKEGTIVFEMTSQMKRTTENVTIDETTSAGPLPPEMAVLDRLVGDWQDTGVIKDAEHPGGLKATWQSTARRILGGRVIAAQQTGPLRDKDAYSLSTFDSFGKTYGRWFFRADGSVVEYGGGWDDQTQTMKWHWAAKDGSQSSDTWQWRGANRRDWQIVTKDALGKTTFDVEATSIRQSEPGWVQLFNGKDLAGWKPHPDQPGGWEVKDGILIGKGPLTHLFSTRGDYCDFHVRLEAKINAAADGGVFFRAPFGLENQGMFPTGYEAQVYQGDDPDVARTGSLFYYKNLWENLAPADTWFTLEIIAEGNRIRLLLNGKPTVEFVDQLSRFSQGHFALQAYFPGAVVQFRKIEIKELPAGADAALAELRRVVVVSEGLLRQARESHAAGTVPTSDVTTAEIDLLEARIPLAEAEQKPADLLALLRELIVKRESELKNARTLLGAGRIPQSAVDVADKRLALARARLAKAEAGLPDAIRLEGKWLPIGAEQHGQPVPEEEIKERICGGLLIRDGRWGSTIGGKQNEGGLHVDSTKTPKEIEFSGSIFEHRIVGRGIYQLDGDTMTLCLAEKGQPRPTTFATDAANSNVLIRYRREAPASDGFVSLFNGKDLTGWKTHPDQPGDWRVENGVIVGSNQRSHLFSERDNFENFHLRFEARFSAFGDGGVFFRAPFAIKPLLNGPPGYEAQISAGTGNLLQDGGNGQGEAVEVPSDTWVPMEVIANGNRIVVRVNGKTTTDFTDPKSAYSRGHVALQTWIPGKAIQFRNIEIKELPAGSGKE